jgi:uncharacterized DUF497 family protein
MKSQLPDRECPVKIVRVSPVEVEEVFANQPRYRKVARGHVQGEDVYGAFGQTEEGRYLAVFFIEKPNEAALVISARDMDAKERKQYERK